MDNILSMIARALGGSIVVYILMEIIQWTVVVLILYTVIKYAVKHAIYESRKEMNYTIRKALLESKEDMETKKDKIPDYRYPDYSELYR